MQPKSCRHGAISCYGLLQLQGSFRVPLPLDYCNCRDLSELMQPQGFESLTNPATMRLMQPQGSLEAPLPRDYCSHGDLSTIAMPSQSNDHMTIETVKISQPLQPLQSLHLTIMKISRPLQSLHMIKQSSQLYTIIIFMQSSRIT